MILWRRTSMQPGRSESSRAYTVSERPEMRTPGRRRRRCVAATSPMSNGSLLGFSFCMCLGLWCHYSFRYLFCWYIMCFAYVYASMCVRLWALVLTFARDFYNCMPLYLSLAGGLRTERCRRRGFDKGPRRSASGSSCRNITTREHSTWMKTVSRSPPRTPRRRFEQHCGSCGVHCWR